MQFPKVTGFYIGKQMRTLRNRPPMSLWSLAIDLGADRCAPWPQPLLESDFGPYFCENETLFHDENTIRWIYCLTRVGLYELFRTRIDQSDKFKIIVKWRCWNRIGFTWNLLKNLPSAVTFFFYDEWTYESRNLFLQNWSLIVYLRNEIKKLMKSRVNQFVQWLALDNEFKFMNAGRVEWKRR